MEKLEYALLILSGVAVIFIVATVWSLLERRYKSDEPES